MVEKIREMWPTEGKLSNLNTTLKEKESSLKILSFYKIH